MKLLAGATLIDVRTGDAAPTDVLIDGERIGAVGGPGEFAGQDVAQTIDIAGKTLLPGLSNNHVHLGWSGMGWDGGPQGVLRDQALHDGNGFNAIKAYANLRKSLKVGLTHLRDLGMNDSGFDAKEALQRGLVKGSRLLIAGRALMCTGGHTWWCGQEVDGVDGMRKAVREQYKRGADLIKVMASEHTPQFSLDELRAAVDEAHTLGMKITTHATLPRAIRNVVEAGFDSIEHGGPCETEVMDMIAERGIFVVPTNSPFILQTSRGPERGMPGHVVEARKARWAAAPRTDPLIEMRKRGVKFAFGTDAGSPCVEHDVIVPEMQILLEYGVVESPLDVIQMLTINSAELRGDERDFGSVEAGKYADLLVVDGDPLANVAALGNVVHVFVGGQQLVRDGALDDWYDW
jgi:imidazolonepropionase-like amidohydrolase